MRSILWQGCILEVGGIGFTGDIPYRALNPVMGGLEANGTSNPVFADIYELIALSLPPIGDIVEKKRLSTDLSKLLPSTLLIYQVMTMH